MTDTLHVYTWREGLLARVGHDLRLSATQVAVKREGDHWVVRVPVAGLKVDGAMHDETLTPVAEKDRRDIEHALQSEVLPDDPMIAFRGNLFGPQHVGGELTLNGQTHPLTLHTHVEGHRARGSVEFAPSRWGVRPYRALLGALRLEDRVRVTFDVAVPEV